MTVIPKTEETVGLGRIAEADVHLPRPEEISSSDSNDDHDHEHGFDLIEVLRVGFVALAASAVWFHLWEPFHPSALLALPPR